MTCATYTCNVNVYVIEPRKNSQYGCSLFIESGRIKAKHSTDTTTTVIWTLIETRKNIPAGFPPKFHLSTGDKDDYGDGIIISTHKFDEQQPNMYFRNSRGSKDGLTWMVDLTSTPNEEIGFPYTVTVDAYVGEAGGYDKCDPADPRIINAN